MDEFEIETLLHRKNKEPQFVEYRREYIEKFAAEQGRTLDSLGEAIWRIAHWLDSMGNRGLSTRFFEDGLPVDVLENTQHAPVWGNILYKNDDDLWFARKKPQHWSLVWGCRFGWGSDIGQQIIAGHHLEAAVLHAEVLAYFERRKPKRKTDTLAGKPVEEIETREVAYIAAVAEVLYRRYIGIGFASAAGILRYHYQALYRDALAELNYRTQSEPKERSSKKKTRAALEDWAKARLFLDAGTHHFFTEAFIKQAVQSAVEPDLDVDFDRLPKMPLEETPIRWLNDGELVQQFMKWVDAESDPASFEYEDKRLIMERLRAMFARAKGQKLDEEPALHQEEER